MDEQLRAAALGEIATEARVERASFLTDAARQFIGFLEANRERIRDLGGLVLIDDEPEYLAITAEGTFRSRTRYQDASGEWVAEPRNGNQRRLEICNHKYLCRTEKPARGRTQTGHGCRGAPPSGCV
jgi:hypothetical protein